MYKIYLLLPLLFSACSHFTFNAAMCDQIASDPHATMPAECRIYNEEDADKAFNNTKNKSMESNESIEFSSEQ